MRNLWIASFLLLIVFNYENANAQLKIAKIFTDHMVLQRGKEIPVWGWTQKGETVTVSFKNQKITAKSGIDGKWMVRLKPEQEGGPFDMNISNKKTQINLKDILVGDVWICSGQSNMDFELARCNNSVIEINNANYPQIRFFDVENTTSPKLENDLKSGNWKICNPETAGKFSGAGYFFGRELNEKLKIPIGLICSSVGGTAVETWMSADALSEFPVFADRIKNMDTTSFEAQSKKAFDRRNAFVNELSALDNGLNSKGNEWYNINTNTSDWKKIEIPGFFEAAGVDLSNFDGAVWIRKDFDFNGDVTKASALSLGIIDDGDMVWINGTKIGETIDDYLKIRNYEVPANILKTGKNTIVIRVMDYWGNGGFASSAQNLYLQNGTEKISLAGSCLFKTGHDAMQIPMVTGNQTPTMHYNCMIHPLIPFGIKGAIWYQGEANASRAYQYRTLFPKMIKNWRQKWVQDDFPFYFVQLTNFMSASEKPQSSEWAELREAQSMTLSLPNTGMACIIDIGDANDIHPTNKQDVGKRLALNALKLTYNKDIVHSGPTYKSMRIEGNKAFIEFSNVGSGLMINDLYGYLKGFTIADKSEVFHWAKAELFDNKTVVVYSSSVAYPVSVRYAWADNPFDANLYNKEMLPTIPFRTDDWELITKNNK